MTRFGGLRSVKGNTSTVHARKKGSRYTLCGRHVTRATTPMYADHWSDWIGSSVRCGTCDRLTDGRPS